MKHILNEMSEEEKNLIRQQHTGGMKVNTERFNKLLESKSGDVKPLINEQMVNAISKGITGVSTKNQITLPNKVKSSATDMNNGKQIWSGEAIWNPDFESYQSKIPKSSVNVNGSTIKFYFAMPTNLINEVIPINQNQQAKMDISYSSDFASMTRVFKNASEFMDGRTFAEFKAPSAPTKDKTVGISVLFV